VQRELNPIFTNTQYNVTKQLQKKLEFLWRVDGYISDAERDGDRDAAEVFRQIKSDEQKHAQMLKELVMLFRITM
jgi:rubrerythrin